MFDFVKRVYNWLRMACAKYSFLCEGAAKSLEKFLPFDWRSPGVKASEQSRTG